MSVSVRVRPRVSVRVSEREREYIPISKRLNDSLASYATSVMPDDLRHHILHDKYSIPRATPSISVHESSSYYAEQAQTCPGRPSPSPGCPAPR